MTDKITIIIPCYNHERFVLDAIASCDKQLTNGFEVEIIVIDDKSKDNSAELIRNFATKNKCTKIFNETNLGLNETIRKASKPLTGNYVALLASDDVIAPNKLLTQYQEIKAKSIDCCYANSDVIDSNGCYLYTPNLDRFEEAIKKGDAFNYIARDDTSGPLLQSALMTSKAFASLDQIRAAYKSDDWVCLLHLLKTANVGFINNPLVSYRIHDKNAHTNHWKTFPMRMEIPCVFLRDDKKNRNKCISNLMISHAAACLRNKEYGATLRFILTSMCFGNPVNKIWNSLIKKW